MAPGSRSVAAWMPWKLSRSTIIAGAQNSASTPGSIPWKPARADADHGVFHAADLDGLADDVGPAAEPALPEAVAEDHDRVLAFADVLVGDEAAAESGPQAEHVEVVRR